LEPRRVRRPVVADLHHFDEEQGPDTQQSKKSEPDPHQSKKDANNMAMNFRRFASTLQYKVDTEDTLSRKSLVS
jgi:hypothetical protein